jgi:hypothetical protein
MPDIHEAEARKLDRLVFGDGEASSAGGANGSRAAAVDAAQR